MRASWFFISGCSAIAHAELLALARIAHRRVERGLARCRRACAATPSRALFISESIARKPWPFSPIRHATRLVERDRRGRRAVDAELLLEPHHLEPVRACRRAACAGTGRARGRSSCRGSCRRCRRRARARGAPAAPPLVMKIFSPSRRISPPLLGGARADRAEVRAGLRLGQVHRAHQLARGEARQVALLQLVGSRRSGCPRRRRPGAR